MTDIKDEELEEPDSLCCPITRVLYSDPVVLVDSGNTYEREAILKHCSTTGWTDPMTNEKLSSAAVVTNWDKRRDLESFLESHPDYIPHWGSRAIPPPSSKELHVPQNPPARPGHHTLNLKLDVHLSGKQLLGIMVSCWCAWKLYYWIYP